MPTLDTACHEAAAQAKAGGASGTPGGAAITLLSLNNHAVVRLSTYRAPAAFLPAPAARLPATCLGRDESDAELKEWCRLGDSNT